MREWETMISTGIGALGVMWIIWGAASFGFNLSVDAHALIGSAFLSMGVSHCIVSYKCWCKIGS